MAEGDSWDADPFDPDEPAIGAKKAVVADKWEGEDADEDIKDNWDDDEEKLKNAEEKKAAKLSEKKKLAEKIKEKESLQRKKQEELRKRLEESQETELTPEEELAKKLQEEETELTPEEELAKKLQEEAGLLLAQDAFGVVNNVKGIDAVSPTSKDDFTDFEKLLKDKISPFESSIHYSGFLESLFRDLCLSLEVEDFKKVSNSLTVLLSEKQKQEKNKGKKKKKVPTGGMKVKMKDDLADYGEFQGGYAQDYEDFM
ncbi:eukaryotic translation initiation factor 3 subunit J-A-like [Coregonus clupeaformis]|uniref:eukaryotic translation initiation factor 3 subunit J-A-like n=1 Tax=Coregonus clupeaformis TaxID=59861 RepID=UPI001E1C8C86|nr:eukaryotic translation initiation factor 3 subunit J-A-like [Coregonus clupeaformis]